MASSCHGDGTFVPWRKRPESNNLKCKEHLQATERTDREENMTESLRLFWSDEGQDMAEYAVMLAVILIIVIATIRHVGGHANRVFSHVASSIQ